MKVHLKQIPAIGIHLEGEEDHDILELDDDQVHPIGTVDYSLDIGVSRSSLFATGEIGADFELVCVNCLKRFVYSVRIPYEILARISARIINEVNGINRVCYDVSSKPPSTIEWE